MDTSRGGPSKRMGNGIPLRDLEGTMDSEVFGLLIDIFWWLRR